MKIYTNIKTLKKVKKIANQIGLGNLIDGNDKETPSLNVAEIINKLIDEGLLVEFLQTITRNTEIDFEEMEAEEIGELIDGFFINTAKFLPTFLREQITGLFLLKTSS